MDWMENMRRRSCLQAKYIDRNIQALLLLTLIGTLLRFYHLDYNSLWLDEATTYLYAQRSFLEIWDITTGGEINPPIFYWIEHVMLPFGNSEFVLRLAPAMLGILTIPLFYLIGRELVDENVGLIAAAVLSFSPFHIYYSQEARAYTSVLFFLSLALICYLRAGSSRELKYWILFGIFSAFAFWTHFYSFIVIGTLFLFELATHFRKILKNPIELKPVLLALAAFTAICLPLLIVAVRYLFIRTGSSPVFGLQGSKFLHDSTWQIFGYSNIPEYLLLTLFGIGLVQLFRTNFSKFQLWTTVIVVTLLASVLLSYKMPMVPRYLTILLPFVYTCTAAAYGAVSSISSHRAFLYLLIIALFAASIPFYQEYYTSYSRSDWNGLASELQNVTHDGDLVIVLPEYIRMPLDYYYSNASDRTIEYGASSEKDLERLCESGEFARTFFVSTADIFAADPSRGSYQWLMANSSAIKIKSRNSGKMTPKIWIYQMINESDPLNANSWNHKGKSLFKLGKYEEAIEAFDKAIEVNPRLAVAWMNKGVALNKLRRYNESLQAYNKAIEINPKLALSIRPKKSPPINR